MHGTVPAAWIRAWLIYHNYIWGGEARFFFYNVGGLKDEDRALFKDFLDAGILSIEDLASPDFHSDFPMWYFHQLLYINDCLHRSRPIADFAFFADFDEYLQVSKPLPLALSSKLFPEFQLQLISPSRYNTSSTHSSHHRTLSSNHNL